MIGKNKIPTAAFYVSLSEAFASTFADKVNSTLSNMLAIDFTLHQDERPDDTPSSRAAYCIENIKCYLDSTGETFDDSFDAATALFSIAITPHHHNHIDSSVQFHDKQNLLNDYIETHMIDLSGEEKESMIDALSILLDSKDPHSMLQFIKGNAKLVAAINSKHTSQMKKVRAHMIAGEVQELHSAMHQNASKTPLTNDVMVQALIGDLAKHTSSQEYKPAKGGSVAKGAATVSIRGM